MNRCCLTILIGLSIGGFSHASALYTPCEKTYIDPYLIRLDQHKIEVENGEEKIQTSALYLDDSGIYFQDFLEQQQQQQEDPIECFYLEEPIDCFIEVKEEESIAQVQESEVSAPLQDSPSKSKPETRFWGKRKRTGLFQ